MTSAPTFAPITSIPTYAGEGFNGHGGGGGGYSNSGNTMTQDSASAGGNTFISKAFDSNGQSQTPNQQFAAAAIRDRYLVQLLGLSDANINILAI